MTRVLDFFFSLFGILILSPLFILLLIIGLFDNSSPIFKQIRVGIYQKPFILIKFRTMPLGTKSAATHLVKNLKLSFFCIFLLNQKKLINERKKRGVFKIRPGITGLAQIKGITMKNPTLLAKTDTEMIKQLNIFNYFYYILVTMILIFKK